MEYLTGQDIDNMSKEDLMKLLKGFYQKCIKNVGYEGLTIGKYYHIDQTDNDEITVYTDNGIEYMDFSTAYRYFES